MKKIVTICVLLGVTFSAFANRYFNFHTSCGETVRVEVYYDDDATCIEALKLVNKAVCGTDNVTITIY